jgi:hypothetical protein
MSVSSETDSVEAKKCDTHQKSPSDSSFGKDLDSAVKWMLLKEGAGPEKDAGELAAA